MLPLDTGDVCCPMPICTRSYQCFPLLSPPLISSAILSSSSVILVICTRSPVRAAGPNCFAASSHLALSYFPVDSNSSGFLDRGRNVLTVAYSAIRPRTSSTRSSYVSLSALRRGIGNAGSAAISATAIRQRIRYVCRFVEQQVPLRADRRFPQEEEQREEHNRCLNARLGTIFPTAPQLSSLPLEFVTRHTHFNPAETGAEERQCKVPSEVQAKWKPQVPAAPESVPKQHPEPSRIRQAEV